MRKLIFLLFMVAGLVAQGLGSGPSDSPAQASLVPGSQGSPADGGMLYFSDAQAQSFDDGLIATHYSHSSHASHYSHRSHYSHQSHYSGY